jgi:hypothetical protein
MALPYEAALAKLEGYCEEFGRALYGPRQEHSEAVRISLRERRDYWHSIGSRIRRRMARESARDRE